MTCPDQLTCQCGEAYDDLVDLLNHCRLMHPDADVDPVEEETADVTAPTTGGPVDYQQPEGCVCHWREYTDAGDVRYAPPEGCPVHTPWAFPGYSLTQEYGVPPVIEQRMDEILAEITAGLDLPPGVALAWDTDPIFRRDGHWAPPVE